MDLGSRNGTYLNGKRMSNAKQESDAIVVNHGSTLQLSQTKLLCHIHEGNTTCDECEPGLVSESIAAGVMTTSVAALGEFDVAEKDLPPTALDMHKAEMKRLKKRYGLADHSKSLKFL